MTKKEIREIVLEIAELLNNKKAEDIVILDFEDNNDFTDYMVICHAESRTQLRALSKYVEDRMRDKGIKPISQKEGIENSTWILLDYIFMVIHIFEKETREFYNIEKLWSEAKVLGYTYNELHNVK